MIKRYPDLGVIILRQEEDEESNGITGYDCSDSEGVEVEGRLELKDSFQKGYTAKFYSPRIDLKEFCADAEKFKCKDRMFELLKVSPHQTHTEIWLK